VLADPSRAVIKWAQIDLGDDDHNHLIPPEAHLQAAMTHQ
jgi:hypothetical protein